MEEREKGDRRKKSKVHPLGSDWEMSWAPSFLTYTNKLAVKRTVQKPFYQSRFEDGHPLSSTTVALWFLFRGLQDKSGFAQ